ncbi:MAG: coenzyme F420-0:L-glutamate ligase [Clostridia bacterium]|nr:coenzyme F420-0:L-glutamate ligase [Clostridia bacterium]MBR2391794.1 coenzyme F420-0:L-glutamate ligase [Clostridia bacterium]
MRTYGTCAFGVRAPIIRPGDDLVSIVADSVLATVEERDIKLKEKDIIAVTEAIVAKSQNNFATTEEIAEDVRKKMGKGTVGLIFPILSRNRFTGILEGIKNGVDEIVIQLSYPFDEVGNPLVSIDKLYELGVYNFDKTYTAEEFYKLVGSVEHPFTGMDYIKIYSDICGDKGKVILSNDPLAILKYTKKVINADIHSRFRNKKLLQANGAEIVCSLTDFLNEPTDKHGYHESYGLLGSNRSKEGQLKLFPRGGQEFVEKLQKEIKKRTGVTVECMVYGDGAFKDPVGGIWELADPVVSPAFTDGLLGTPNEIKLKYVADNQIENLTGDKAVSEMKEIIKAKEADLKNKNISLGTTPRRITDLVGSLSDLVSGSGDKGTPIVLITGYFDNYATE